MYRPYIRIIFCVVGIMESSTEVKDVILCIENLKVTFSQESDERNKVWLKANKIKQEKTIQRKEDNRMETIQLMIVVTLMLTVALTVVTLKISITGVPTSNYKTVPPYHENLTTYPLYQYVMDWNVDFPEAKADERRIPILLSSLV